MVVGISCIQNTQGYEEVGLKRSDESAAIHRPRRPKLNLGYHPLVQQWSSNKPGCQLEVEEEEQEEEVPMSSTEPYAKTQKNNLNPTAAPDVTLLMLLLHQKTSIWLLQICRCGC